MNSSRAGLRQLESNRERVMQFITGDASTRARFREIFHFLGKLSQGYPLRTIESYFLELYSYFLLLLNEEALRYVSPDVHLEVIRIVDFFIEHWGDAIDVELMKGKKELVRKSLIEVYAVLGEWESVSTGLIDVTGEHIGEALKDEFEGCRPNDLLSNLEHVCSLLQKQHRKDSRTHSCRN